MGTARFFCKIVSGSLPSGTEETATAFIEQVKADLSQHNVFKIFFFMRPSRENPIAEMKGYLTVLITPKHKKRVPIVIMKGLVCLKTGSTYDHTVSCRLVKIELGLQQASISRSIIPTTSK